MLIPLLRSPRPGRGARARARRECGVPSRSTAAGAVRDTGGYFVVQGCPLLLVLWCTPIVTCVPFCTLLPAAGDWFWTVPGSMQSNTLVTITVRSSAESLDEACDCSS